MNTNELNQRRKFVLNFAVQFLDEPILGLYINNAASNQQLRNIQYRVIGDNEDLMSLDATFRRIIVTGFVDGFTQNTIARIRREVRNTYNDFIANTLTDVEDDNSSDEGMGLSGKKGVFSSILSSTDIEEICDSLKLPLVGVFSKNKLPSKRLIGSYYINLQDEEDGNGTHWTWFRIFESGKAVYFDSFGVQLPEDIKEFLKPFTPIPYNNRQIQDINSTFCGWFCVACDYYFTYEAKRKDTEEDFDDFLNLFSINKKANDKIVIEFLTK